LFEKFRDDYFPEVGGELYYAKSTRRGELWVPLLEKAIAKLIGNGYKGLHPSTGHAYNSCTFLTYVFGGKPMCMSWTEKTSEVRN